MKLYICDRCKKYIDKELDQEEVFYIKHLCGYNSVFEDGCAIDLHICQDCIKEVLGDFIRKNM